MDKEPALSKTKTLLQVVAWLKVEEIRKHRAFQLEEPLEM